MRRATLVVSAVAVATAVLLIAHQRRTPSETSAMAPHDATRGAAEEAPTGPVMTTRETRNPESPTAAPGNTTFPAEAAPASGEPAPAEQDLGALVAGIDPLLVERNVIVRKQDPAQSGPEFVELEQRFSIEVADEDWSNGMEARILTEVSQITDLKLVSLDAECRQTVCRLKFFHPSGTNALSALDKLKPIAKEIGFGHVVEVATLGADGVPISLLYFEREGA